MEEKPLASLLLAVICLATFVCVLNATISFAQNEDQRNTKNKNAVKELDDKVISFSAPNLTLIDEAELEKAGPITIVSENQLREAACNATQTFYVKSNSGNRLLVYRLNRDETLLGAKIGQSVIEGKEPWYCYELKVKDIDLNNGSIEMTYQAKAITERDDVTFGLLTIAAMLLFLLAISFVGCLNLFFKTL